MGSPPALVGGSAVCPGRDLYANVPRQDGREASHLGAQVGGVEMGYRQYYYATIFPAKTFQGLSFWVVLCFEEMSLLKKMLTGVPATK